MVVSEITTGLGNQLFQYAFARNLTHMNKTSLYFDISHYNFVYPSIMERKFKLNNFNIQYKILDNSPFSYTTKFAKHLPLKSLPPLYEILNEKEFVFDETLLVKKAKLIFLKGFWQSEKYFIGCTDMIRNELTFANVPGENFSKYKSKINDSLVSVSLHIRRGDYVYHPNANKIHGFLGMDYYKRAIIFLKERVANFTLFIFSDDREWAENEFKVNNKSIIVKTNGEMSDIDDLHLMSLCDHNIVANSSYSWWGAWLNTNASKNVIAPKQWFNTMPEGKTKDLFPSSWIIM